MFFDTWKSNHLLFFYLSITDFSILLTHSNSTGCKEKLREGVGVILELTLRAEVNVKITNHYLIKQCLKLNTTCI